jgi:hypothetical protein
LKPNNYQAQQHTGQAGKQSEIAKLIEMILNQSVKRVDRMIEETGALYAIDSATTKAQATQQERQRNQRSDQFSILFGTHTHA